MAECLFIKTDEVTRMLGVSQSEAYRIIKKLNEEMAAKGYIVVNGRVNRKYLEEQIYGYQPEHRQGGK
jgi:DNA-binding Lrp family transcriptional regulator